MQKAPQREQNIHLIAAMYLEIVKPNGAPDLG